MRLALLEFLCCPECRGTLDCEAAVTEGDHVMAGELRCRGCSGRYAVLRGIPRMTVGAEAPDMRHTAAAFGYSWNRFRHFDPQYKQQFLDWIAPLSEADMSGRVVLDAGCGKGRHLLVAQSFGPRAVIGVDLSEAVELAFEATADLPNVHIVQANIYRLPFRPQTFDCVWSVGVLHHLPDPAAGFRSVFDGVKAGGRIAVWVYGRENNEWIVQLVNPLREKVFARMPRWLLYGLSALISVPLYTVLKLVYGPFTAANSALAARWLPYQAYCAYIARFPIREIHHIVFDQLVAPTSYYLPQEEVRNWFARPDVQRVVVAWHNRNSWRGFAERVEGRKASIE